MALAASVFAACIGAGAGAARAETPPEYYLALGDSGAVGYQPGKGPTDEGYTDVLYADLKKTHANLKLVKLGCPGETTTTMLHGGICEYPEGSQMDAAVAFLKQHAGDVRYVTVSIGVNNTACLLNGDVECGLRGAVNLAAELPQIAGGLHAAGGDTPDYASMTYYDPGLASWITGGQAVAVASVPALDVFNAWQRAVFWVNGFEIADVDGAFATHDFTTTTDLPPYGTLPLNVARICAWTYQCSQNDGHANAEGYRQIAAAFSKALS
ncbi:SGNH/GDSL hydrolase family protein [Actinomadura atramentaria]|uniref:SGNH/GDSL hydrolase family protein n=1 Tax=Actinomadura atramentaria TaxID=1990 RepID=UPI00035C9BC7|nr:SGNH/GDSL hydrolase family protein [Actinomadura atramentaria]